MIWHNCGLPDLNLGIIKMYLGYFFITNGAPKCTKLNMREIQCATSMAEIPFQCAEKRLSSFGAEGNHIKSSIVIVLPWGTAMLVVLYVPRGDMKLLEFFKCM